MNRRSLLALLPLLLTACPNRHEGPPDAGAAPAGPQRLTEKEPNDRQDQALVLTGSSVVTASLSADPARPDEDWYELSTPAPRTVDLQVSGIPGADVALEVYDADHNRLIAVNSQGEGKPERLPNLGLKAPLWVKVYSARKGSGGAYTLTATFSEPQPGFEVEPNDRAVDANVLPLGQSISGYIGHAGDEDWYRIELPVPAGTSPDASTPGPTPDGGGAPEPGLDAGPPPDAGAPAPDAGAPAPAPDAGAPPDAGPAPTPDGGMLARPPAPVEPPGMALKIGLTGVEDVRLDVQVLSEAEAPLFEAKGGKEGEGLTLRNIGVRATDRVIYVVVKSAWSGTGKEARRGFNPDKPYTLTVSPEEAGANAELEPNDELAKATPLPLNGYREGFISPKGDVDYYVLRTDTPVLARVQLSGVERLDLVLSVVTTGNGDNEPERVLLRINDGGLKEPEYLNNLFCADVCWLKVEAAPHKVDGKWVRDQENPDMPYRLTVTTTPDTGGEEREPNNTPDTATPLALGRPIRGTIYPKRDVDYFRLDLSGRPVRTPIKATVTGILKVHIGLYLHRLDDNGKMTLVQTADRAKGDAPEVIRYSAEPGVYLLEVRDSKNREANFQDSYQLTVEEGE